MILKIRNLTNNQIFLQNLLLIFLTGIFILPIAADPFNLPKLFILSFFVVSLIIQIAFQISKMTLLYLNLDKFEKILLWNVSLLLITMIFSTFLSDVSLYRKIIGQSNRCNGILLYLLVFLMFLSSFLATKSDHHQSAHKSFFLFFVLYSGLTSLYGFIQYFDMDPIQWTNVYSPVISTFGNPNFASSIFAVFAVISFKFAFNESNFFPKSLFMLYGCILLLVSIFTNSIQGPLLFCVGLFILMVQKIWFSHGKILRSLVIFLPLALITLIFTSFLGFGPLGRELRQETLLIRLEYWKIAVRKVADYPWFGIGPDSFVDVFRQERSINFVRKYGDHVLADAAHNSLLNFTLNFGLIAGFFLLSLIIFLTVLAIKNLYLMKSPLFIQCNSLIWILTTLGSIFSIDYISLLTLQWGSACTLVLFHNRKNFGTKRNKEVHMRREGKQLEKRGVIGDDFPTTWTSYIFSFLIIIPLALPILRSNVALNQLSSSAIALSNGLTIKDMNNLRQRIDLFEMQDEKNALKLISYDFALNDLRSAKDTLDFLLRNDKMSADGLANLANIYAFQGFSEMEYETRKNLLSVDPLNRGNLLELAKIYLRNEDNERARVLLQKVLEISGENNSDSQQIEARILIEDLNYTGK